MTDKITGTLEVGTNDRGEVVINHPDPQPDENGVGHIVFSPDQARNLARLLLEHACEVDPRIGVVLWRCAHCDTNLYRPIPIESLGGDLPASECYRVVLEEHARVAPDCIAAHAGHNNIAVDFLVRMVQ